MVQLSANRCSCIAILSVSLVSFVAITIFVASQRVFLVSVYFVIDSVRKLLDIHSYNSQPKSYEEQIDKYGPVSSKSAPQFGLCYLRMDIQKVTDTFLTLFGTRQITRVEM
jgi:hypothetical protein